MFHDIRSESTVMPPRLTPLGTKKNVAVAAVKASSNCRHNTEFTSCSDLVDRV